MRYGFIHQGTFTEEQEAALEWLKSTSNDVWTVELSSLQSSGRGPPEDKPGRGPGHPNIRSLDALWWHRDHDINEFSLIHDESVRDELVSYIEDGGGLLLTQHAFEVAHILDIETLPPDTDEADIEGTSYGFSKRDLYTDHPIFEGFDNREFTTKTESRSHHDSSLYWNLNTPQKGEVLAYLAQSGRRASTKKPLVSWYQGDGAVIGIASCVRFTDTTDQAHEGNLKLLLNNSLSYVSEGGENRLPGENRPRGAESFLELRQRLADNPYRPRYHFAPPANWNNDPCGLVEYEGTYHLFYQHNPHGDFWGNMHWGHAVSDDMIHWEDRPIALSPNPNDPGEFGIFTGCGVNVGDEVLFFYTSVGPESHLKGSGMKQLPSRAAGSNSDLTDVRKYDGNPLMDTPPMGAFSPPYDGSEPSVPFADPGGFRDHHVWQEDDGYWYHMVGSGLQGGVGAAIVFRAKDIRTDDWEFHTTITGDRVGFWECPQLFNFETKSMVHWSLGFFADETVGYNLGNWDASSGDFTIEEQGYVARGEYYAPQAMKTQDGRYVMFGWITPILEFSDGWADTMISLPHTLSEADDGTLRIQPAKEVKNARNDEANSVSRSNTILKRGGGSNEQTPLSDIKHDSVEIDATVESAGATEVSLNVLEHPDGTEITPITYDFEAETLTIDHTSSSAENDRPKADSRPATRSVDVPTNDDGSVNIHVFVDRSIVEVFANGREFVVSRVYPTLGKSNNYSIDADGNVRLRSLNAYQMGPIWDHLDEESPSKASENQGTKPPYGKARGVAESTPTNAFKHRSKHSGRTPQQNNGSDDRSEEEREKDK